MVFGGETAESYYDEGITAGMKGDVLRAVACFEKAIELEPGYVAASHQLARCMLRMGHTTKAVDMLAWVIRSKPSQIPPRLDLGAALLTLGKLAEACDQFNEILRADDNNGRAWLGLAQAAFASGDWAGAVSNTRVSLANTGPNFPALLLLGRATRLTGEFDTSKQALDQADGLIKKSVELNPDLPEGYFLRGEVAFARDQFSSALEQYRSAEDRIDKGRSYSAFGENFSLLEVLARQGLCYERMNQTDRAREMGERILRIDPSHKAGRMLRDLE